MSLFAAGAVGKGFFGVGAEEDALLGSPGYAYDLPIYAYTPLGSPFYHFRSDYGGDVNPGYFTNESGNQAQVGDRIKEWKNSQTHGSTAPHLGNAKVPENWLPGQPIGGNYWGSEGHPLLDYKTYLNPNTGEIKRYQGLRFNGASYLQIDGSEIPDFYGSLIQSPLYSTAGSPSMSGPYANTGATFVFVLDLDGATYWDSNNPPGSLPLGGALQTLLYSRQPCTGRSPIGSPPSPACQSPDLDTAPGYHWPVKTVERGVQFFLVGQDANSPCLPDTMGHPTGGFFGYPPEDRQMHWGPEAVHWDGASVLGGVEFNYPLATADSSTGSPDYGGSHWGIWERHPGPLHSSYKANHAWNGFQIIILEYDSIDEQRFQYDGLNPPEDPLDYCWACRDYTGPRVNVYAMGQQSAEPQHLAPNLTTYPPFNGSTSLANPILTGYSPALRDQLLW